jgi:hypothetical protein
MRGKQFRDVLLFVQHTHHQRLLNLVKSAICHRDCRCHTQRLICEASLTEELTSVQNGDDRLLALLTNLRFPFPEKSLVTMPGIFIIPNRDEQY